jgi:hypothetical protein
MLRLKGVKVDHSAARSRAVEEIVLADVGVYRIMVVTTDLPWLEVVSTARLSLQAKAAP